MKILITGASGLIGSKLIEKLASIDGYHINVLTRNVSKFSQQCQLPISVFHWNPSTNQIDGNTLNGVDCVINLAGAGIADSRWSKSRKHELLESRVKSTKLLLNTIRATNLTPKKFINASAIGIYGDSGSLDCDERSLPGNDFLAQVCDRWEDAASSVTITGMRKHILRIGLVLGSEGGALSKILTSFESGVGGKLGNGQQFMSWIHIDDIVGQFIYLIQNDVNQTVFNATAPAPVTNQEFTQILGEVLNLPTVFSVPSIVLKMILGEMSVLLLTGQKVLPRNFMATTFEYKYPDLKEALTDLLKYKVKGESVFVRNQWIQKPKAEIFEFFSSENNLELITPDSLKFKVLNKTTPKIETGTIINYQLKLYGFPLKWKSHISLFKDNHQFIDEQLKGPYKKWVHLHEFKEVNGGTLIADRVVYKPPFGRVGRFVAGKFIRKDITKIFNYRNEKIHSIFTNTQSNGG